MAIQKNLKGISFHPDGTQVQDGFLRAAVNLCNDGDGLRPLEVPEDVLALAEGDTALWIHEDRYIIMHKVSGVNKLFYKTAATTSADFAEVGDNITIESVGKTLVVNDGVIKYFLWKNNAYLALGSKPPFTGIKFGLNSDFTIYPGWSDPESRTTPTAEITIARTTYFKNAPIPYYGDTASNSLLPPRSAINLHNLPLPDPEDPQSIIYPPFTLDDYANFSLENRIGTAEDSKTEVDSEVDFMTTGALAYVNKFIREEAHKKNKFVFPFFVRYAYRLYDGSTIMHSYPVMLIPNSRGVVFGLDGQHGIKLDVDDYGQSYQKTSYALKGRLYAFLSTLQYRILSKSDDLDNWKDIVTAINIYITPPIYTYDQSGKMYGWKSTENESDWESFYTVSAIKNITPTGETPGTPSPCKLHSFYDVFAKAYLQLMQHANAGGSTDDDLFRVYSTYPAIPYYCLRLPEKKESEVQDALASASNFFKIAEIPFEDISATTAYFDLPIKDNIILTLETNEQMVDDYHSHDDISSDVLYAYNRRLNLGGVMRTPKIIRPSCQFGRYDQNSYPWTQRVILNEDKGEIVLGMMDALVNGGMSYSAMAASDPFVPFIFYPSPTATSAEMNVNSTTYVVPLTQHSGLYGSYWLGKLWHPLDRPATKSGLSTLTVNPIIDEHGKVYTSNVENPFAFESENINFVSDGEIRALCAAVEPLSEGQYGYAPMYCFTSKGVFPLTVNKTGGWGNIPEPVSRDVLLSGAKPLSLNKAVVFRTQRGLVMLTGRGVRTIGDELKNRDSVTLSLLSDIVNLLDIGSLNTAAAITWLPTDAKLMFDYRNSRLYVGNASGTWCYNFKSQLWTQAETKISATLNSYPDCIWQDGTKIKKIGDSVYGKSLAITQPIKYADGMKRIRAMYVRGLFDSETHNVKCALWGTRDWTRYALCGTSDRPHITRMSGTPYKAHIAAIFTNSNTAQSAVDSIVADVSPDLNDKIR